ncbi:transcriptional regulator [Saccharopolyspora subtropica]|uniref:Transcriptional regulator n=1 Tax=Saccharopolyspora thermophila TaxID=89367 RepID=A0A917K834_9PSEU|nr:helix-turn-helix domain-containing protein [Saccharopolyspora subtropica]GGJ03409.1 transcriptional regulator [Saccharopolyspora subtropica]
MTLNDECVTAELLADPLEYASLLEQVWDAVLRGGRAPKPPRPLVSDSWQRSLAADVDPDAREAPVVWERDEVRDRRAAHPLAAAIPVLRETVLSVADEAMHVMIVTDRDGLILWREGSVDVERRADRVRLAEGTRWSEDAIGTNAMGTTLAVGRPVQIYSAEHLVRTYHDWTCAASPIHDPDTGDILGSVDISGPLRTVHPAMVALVSAAAQLAESHLRAQMAARDERLRAKNMPHLRGLRGESGALLTPTGRVLAVEPGPGLRLPERIDVSDGHGPVVLDDGREALLEPLPEGFLLRLPTKNSAAQPRPVLSLSFLNSSGPRAVLDGREIPLTTRHAEILTLLAMSPGGLTADRLAFQLYGERGNPVTARAEIHRLRTHLGEHVIGTKPYRLRAEVDADFLTVRKALRAGNLRAAVESYRGPLLEASESPAIRDEREELFASLRNAALDRGDAEALWALFQHQPTDDLEVLGQLAHRLARHDPRRHLVTARMQRVLAEEA